MRKSVCVKFFEDYLHEVSEGRGYREHANPATAFTKELKAGVFDHVPDETYEDMLKETNNLSAFWLDKPNQTATNILRVALEDIQIDQKALHSLAEIFADCYQQSTAPFLPEDAFVLPEMEDEVFDDFDCQSSEPGEKATNPEAGKKRSLPSFAKTMAGNVKGSDKEILSSPKKIFQYISKQIYGQQDAVRAATMLLYNHVQGRKRNMLFVGPTGCGKTEIWRVCRQLYPSIRIIDSTMLTGEGWVGSFKVKNLFDGMSPEEAESAIIVIDEFDKFCEPRISSGGSDHSQMMQNELLKLIEGNDRAMAREFTFDSSNVSFVFCGSFETLTKMKTKKEKETGLGFGANIRKANALDVYEEYLGPEDLVKYANVRQEIAGRINQVVQLAPMTAEDFREILKDRTMSPLFQMEQQYDVKLLMDKQTEERLVEEAERTHMGVRYLRSRIQKMLDDQMFEDCDRQEYQLGA